MMEIKPYIDAYGDIFWRLPNGMIHREDGPAIERYNGTKLWYINGNCHRLDGPAIEWKGDTLTEWYINDWNVTRQIKEWAFEYNIDLDNLSEEDKFMIRLHWENYNGE